MPYRRKTKKRSFLLPLLVVGISLLAAKNYVEWNIYAPLDEFDEQQIVFEVKKGTPITTIAKNLKEKDLIRNELLFKLYTQFNDLDTKIKAGKFILTRRQNYPELIEYLTKSKQGSVVITIKEGLDVFEIDQKLEELGLSKNQEFVNATKNFDRNQYAFLPKPRKNAFTPLEGYLFPDTYFLDPSSYTHEGFINTLVSNFEKKVLDKTSITPKDLHDTIIMASILEKEAQKSEDLPVIAGILWKRLKSNWHLGADATVIYVTKDKSISSADLKVNSPYNTRRFTGLPPGPITNPGIRTIKAAAEPENSPYWYYLHTPTGKTIYSKTNEEHNQNKYRYLR